MIISSFLCVGLAWHILVICLTDLSSLTYNLSKLNLTQRVTWALAATHKINIYYHGWRSHLSPQGRDIRYQLTLRSGSDMTCVVLQMIYCPLSLLVYVVIIVIVVITRTPGHSDSHMAIVSSSASFRASITSLYSGRVLCMCSNLY